MYTLFILLGYSGGVYCPYADTIYLNDKTFNHLFVYTFITPN